MFGKEKGITITVDHEKCVTCGQCVDICFGNLEMVNKKVRANKNSIFGCIQCGNCMNICPEDCIAVEGPWVSQDRVQPLTGHKPHVDDLFYLFKKRRSIRQFKDMEVDQALIDQIIDAGTTAPMGLPPSEVKVIVINGKQKVQAFADDLIEAFEEMLKFFNPVVLTAFRPVMGKVQHQIYKEFIIPLIKMTVEERKKGNDILFYNAPAVMVFSTGKYAVEEDAVLASTYCQIMAEALDLGTCVIGSIAPGIDKSKKIRAKYGIGPDDQVNTGFILGHPVKDFTKSVKREFMDVKYIQ